MTEAETGRERNFAPPRCHTLAFCIQLGAGVILCVAGRASAVLVNLGPGSFTPLAPVIRFDEVGLGTSNPSFPFTGLQSLGNITVSFGGHFVGQVASGGSPSTLVDNTPSNPLALDPNAPTTKTATDSSNDMSPVLSGTPQFNGPISVFFSKPVAGVGLTGGYFDTVGATAIEAYAADGTVLGRITNSTLALEFYGLADSSRANVIKGISFFITGAEPAGFAIDNLTFGAAADIVLPTATPTPTPVTQSGDCCAAHDGTGCDDFICEGCVCLVDSFCCDTAWDSSCAMTAIDCADFGLCACGAPPPPTPTRTRTPTPTRTRTPTPTVPLGNDCCAAHGAPGCSVSACENCVCDATFDDCCFNDWDQTCTMVAANECALFCGCGGSVTPTPTRTRTPTPEPCMQGGGYQFLGGSGNGGAFSGSITLQPGLVFSPNVCTATEGTCTINGSTATWTATLQPLQAGGFEVHYVAADNVPAGTRLCAMGVIHNPALGDLPAGNCFTACGPPTPTPTPNSTPTPKPCSLLYGQPFTRGPFTFNNIGQITGTAVSTVTLPAGLSAVPGTCASTTCACNIVNASTVTCTGTVAPGNSTQFTFAMQVADSTPPGTQLCYTLSGVFNQNPPASVQICESTCPKPFATATASRTASPTQTRTFTPTRSPTPTFTPPPSFTRTRTLTFTATQTPRFTPTRTPTFTVTQTASSTTTRAPTFTATSASTSRATATITRSKETFTPTHTLPPTLTPTAAPTPSATPPPTSTPTTTPTAGFDLVADALEVTQAVQDLHNSVRLVANKRAFVRFHVHSTLGNAMATAQLRVQRGGDTATLNPVNPGGQILVRRAPNRGVRDHAFLFQLPSGFREGTVSLTAELNPTGVPVEGDASNNTASTTVTFESVPPQFLVMYKVGYETEAGTVYPSDEHRAQMVVWLRRAYPVSDVHVVLRSYLYGRAAADGSGNLIDPSCSTVNAFLSSKRLFDLASSTEVPANARYYGLVADNSGFMRGCADLPGFVGSGPDGDPNPRFAWDGDGSYGDFYGGHELGHTFNRFHAEFCGASAGMPYPYPGGRISPTLAGNQALYGFDIVTRDIYPPSWTDVMSYCPYEWVSDLTYHGLMDRMQSGGGAAAVARDVNQTDRLLVVGSIDLTTGAVQLQPLVVVPNAGELKERVPGPFTIVLRDADGTELARYPFTPSEIHEGPGRAADTNPDRKVDLLFINELVPFVPGTTRVDILGVQGAMLRSVTAGAAPPSVTLTSPNGGETLDQPTITVTWTASDPDGDPLSFTLQYSKDDGATWEVIAQNIAARRVDLVAANIARAAQGRFRVLVSDGVHTASDDSDAPFTVPNHAPSARITEPSGSVTIAAGQTLALEGDAYDIDTGTMASLQLQWASSIDGPLGSGASLGVSTLSVGTHTITFRADDGEGGVATATVQVTVVASLGELPPVADALAAGPSLITLDPAGGHATATLSIDNANAGNSIGWSAASSQPWVQLSTTSGNTPVDVTVAFDSAGLSTGRNAATITLNSAAGSVTVAVEAIVPTCAGDCNGNGEVTIDELITGVNIALGNALLSTCPVFDASGDGTVTVNELIAAVNKAVSGCA